MRSSERVSTREVRGASYESATKERETWEGALSIGTPSKLRFITEESERERPKKRKGGGFELDGSRKCALEKIKDNMFMEGREKTQ